MTHSQNTTVQEAGNSQIKVPTRLGSGRVFGAEKSLDLLPNTQWLAFHDLRGGLSERKTVPQALL